MYWLRVALKWLVVAAWVAAGIVLLVAGNGVEIPMLRLPDIRGGYGVYAGAVIVICALALAATVPIRRIRRTALRPFD